MNRVFLKKESHEVGLDHGLVLQERDLQSHGYCVIFTVAVIGEIVDAL